LAVSYFRIGDTKLSKLSILPFLRCEDNRFWTKDYRLALLDLSRRKQTTLNWIHKSDFSMSSDTTLTGKPFFKLS